MHFNFITKHLCPIGRRIFVFVFICDSNGTRQCKNELFVYCTEMKVMLLSQYIRQIRLVWWFHTQSIQCFRRGDVTQKQLEIAGQLEAYSTGAILQNLIDKLTGNENDMILSPKIFKHGNKHIASLLDCKSIVELTLKTSIHKH